MDPEADRERRLARARTLTATHSSDMGAYYVDVATYPGRPGTYAAAVIAATSGKLCTAGSVRARDPVQAEELAIALALANPNCTTILSDSKSAIMNFAKNNVSPCAARVCGALTQRAVPVVLKWFPAHMGPMDTGANRNEGADRAARALTSRSADHNPQPAEEINDEDMEPITSYKDVMSWYREGRRKYPPPHKQLTRQEATMLRQLQTRAMWTPVVAKHVCPDLYTSDVCAVCGADRATMAHMLWNCAVEDSATDMLPPRLASAVTHTDLNAQREAVQLALVALKRQQPTALPPHRGSGACR